jgi:soluble lytic murein transglycosylase-like protein
MCAACALAAEFAVLDNGFRLRAERHEIDGGIVRLFTADGHMDLPVALVLRFEQEQYVAEPPTVESVEPLEPDAVELLNAAATRYGLPAEFLVSVAAAESGLRQDAVSPKGAIGIMQLMPETAAELGADPRDASQNVDAGARHLRDLLVRYDGGVFRALAAYNAGAAAVERHDGIPPYRETRLYIERVLDRFEGETPAE